jgi:hypothetical protein
MSKRTSLKMVSFKLSRSTRGTLNRVSRIKGWTKTHTVETAIKNLEITIRQHPQN